MILENAVIKYRWILWLSFNTLSIQLLEGVPNYPMLNLPDAKIGVKSLSCLSRYPHEAGKMWILINIGIFYSIEISLHI
jgi:hypothetical protein